MRRAAKRDTNEAEIIRELRRIEGVSVKQLNDRNLPDLLVGFQCKSGRLMNLLIEVKEPKGKLNKGQIEFFDTWNGQVIVARSIEEALNIVYSARRDN